MDGVIILGECILVSEALRCQVPEILRPAHFYVHHAVEDSRLHVLAEDGTEDYRDKNGVHLQGTI